MLRIKNKIIALCLSLGVATGILFSPVSAYAATKSDLPVANIVAASSTDQVDGKLDTFYQGSSPDCSAVAAIQTLANSTYGRSLLSKMITVNSNNSYTLNFATGKQMVSKTDVANAFIRGDLDAKVIEAGLIKAMKIAPCFAHDVFGVFTGYEKVTYFEKNSAPGTSNKVSIMNLLASKCESGQGFMATCDFNIADSSRGILGNGSHAYSIKSITKDTVVVINPWDTSKLISMPRSQFENSIRYISYVADVSQKVVIFWNM